MSIAARRMMKVAKVPSQGGGFIPNLINNPHLGGYPDETNTGVPASTILTNYSGTMNVTTSGAIIQNYNISGDIVVDADNVTIRNCRVTSGGYYPIRWYGDEHTGLLVEDCEIIGTSDNVTAGMSFRNYTARRVFVTGCADGFKADANVLIEDCYVTGLRVTQDSHNDGVQTTGGSDVTLRHNTFKLGNQSGVSAVVQVGNEWGTNSNWLIENNLIDGGGWSINASNNPAMNPNFRILNNRFTRRAGYGPGNVGGNVWSGNIYDDNGAVVPG